ncbi:glycosyltransferase [Alkalicoccus urumqiensis]|uniref:Glycosyl transferase family 2 n=1 Tax=Alkalicoccus urumqiensis TaxID=1548213 RepID=A0A2P6MIL1_ALKUR|nr:glycosyltransferase family A protein [Alkalicoccus urumqiensis]PRO66126.1 glycosyl transferase family 2 [Alkalicoccus urumqiensis]
MLWLLVPAFAAALFISIQWFYGARNMPMPAKEHSVPAHSPKVSVITAARNEEKNIYHSVQSLLNLRYPDVEIIVVNDRSTDATGRLLQQLKNDHPNSSRLTVKTVSELPEGWLGKNHALHTGARLAGGEWLLFTDADVLMEPSSLQKALTYAEKEKLDHLTLTPDNPGGTAAYRMFYTYWTILGLWNFIQLGYAGIGAFQLLRKNVYDEIGGHQSTAMDTDDDLKLGRMIKNQGFRQQLGFGRGLFSVQWYESLPEMTAGLEKNLFAFTGYSIPRALAATAAVGWLHILPFFFWLYPGASAWLGAAIVLIYAGMYMYNQRLSGESALFAVLMPVSAALFLYCLNRSMFITLRHNGVTWRGTHYSLSELRSHQKKNKRTQRK